MKIDNKTWEDIRYTLELHLANDSNITDILIDYQLKKTSGVKNYLKINARL